MNTDLVFLNARAGRYRGAGVHPPLLGRNPLRDPLGRDPLRDHLRELLRNSYRDSYRNPLVGRPGLSRAALFRGGPPLDPLGAQYPESMPPLRRGYHSELYDPLRSRMAPREPQRVFDLSLARPYSNPYFDDGYDRCTCDACRPKRPSCQQDSCHQRGHCSCSRLYCEKTNSNKTHFDFKTKDITIRGKARVIRASYLTEAGKFEQELTKYLDKKDDTVVPDKVIDMLFSFINCESYENNDPLDEITLNILAHNVGARSAVQYSLDRLKKVDIEVVPQDLTHIVATIIMSTKVDSGLKEWLKKFLKNDERYLRLRGSGSWWAMLRDRPEVEIETLRLLGEIPEAPDEGIRLL